MRTCLEELSKPNSGVCVGLDPDLEKLPEELDGLATKERIKVFLQEVVERTKDIACAYKLQKAFFALYDCTGKGGVMEQLIAYIHKEVPHAPVIIDGKIGDTQNTMRAYVKKDFDILDADGIVVNPYMGDDVFESLTGHKDRGIFVLCKTSNAGAAVIQEREIVIGDKKIPVWAYVLRSVMDKWNDHGNIIPIVSGSAAARYTREHIPDTTPVFYAGVGAQGAALEGTQYLFNSKRSGVVVNSSRGILYPYERDDPAWRERITGAARKLESQIAEIRGRVS